MVLQALIAIKIWSVKIFDFATDNYIIVRFGNGPCYCYRYIHQVVSIYLHFSGDKQSIIGLRSGMLLFFVKSSHHHNSSGWVVAG